jgi:hypothetical protein
MPAQYLPSTTQKNFLFLHLRTPDGAPGHLLGGQRGKPNLTLTPAAQPQRGRRALWRLTDSGALELGGAPGTVLGVEPDGQLALHRLAPGQTEPAAGDRWTVDASGRLRHQASGKGVRPLQAEGDPVAAQLVADDSTSNPAQAFVEELGTVVQNALKDPKPFPTYQGGQGAAYSYIEQKLGVPQGTDLRSQYTNAVINLATYSSQLAGLAYPGGTAFTSNDFTVVKTQLQAELSAVLNVQEVFKQTKAFWNYVFNNESGYLTNLQNDLNAVGQTPQSSLGAVTFFVNILYTAFSLFGTVGGLLANLMATAFNTAVANGALSNTATPVSFNKLQDDLSTRCDSVLRQLTQQVDQILGNWSPTQNLSQYAQGKGAVTNTQLFDAQLAAQYSYLEQVLQNVLPGMCRSNRMYFVSSTQSAPNGVPDYATYRYNNGSGNFLFYIDMVNGKALPELVADLVYRGPTAQAANADDKAFFLGMEGWEWTTIDSQGNYDDGNYLVVNVFNQTSGTIQVKAEAKQGNLQQPNPHNQQTVFNLNSGEVGFVITSYHNLGLETKVKLEDSQGNDLVKFDCHQKNKLVGGELWVSDKTTVNSHYQLAASTLPRDSSTTPQEPGQVMATLSSAAA